MKTSLKRIPLGPDNTQRQSVMERSSFPLSSDIRTAGDR